MPNICRLDKQRGGGGGLIKPSDIVHISCAFAWNMYTRIMDSYEAKSYFLKCKHQRKVFVKVTVAETSINDNYSSILEARCTQNHPFISIFEKLLCKNFASEVHQGKKRNAVVKNGSVHAKIKKLQSQ